MLKGPRVAPQLFSIILYGRMCRELSLAALEYYALFTLGQSVYQMLVPLGPKSFIWGKGRLAAEHPQRQFKHRHCGEG